MSGYDEQEFVTRIKHVITDMELRSIAQRIAAEHAEAQEQGSMWGNYLAYDWETGECSGRVIPPDEDRSYIDALAIKVPNREDKAVDADNIEQMLREHLERVEG